MKCPDCGSEMFLEKYMCLDYKGSVQELAHPYWICPRCKIEIDKGEDMTDRKEASVEELAQMIKNTVIIKTFTNSHSTHQRVEGLGSLAQAILDKYEVKEKK